MVKEINVGETFSLEFNANLSTGFSWSYKPKTSTIISIMEEHINNSSSKIGSHNKTIFLITGIKKGKEKVDFYYQKSWEKAVSPIETKQIIILVK